MRSPSLFSTYLALALTASGCAATTPYNPFKIPPEDIKAKVKVVALAPINFPTDIDDPEPVKAKFESLVTAKLQEGGFTVVSSAEYGAIWKQMTEQLGGFFDPMTGKRDEQKYKTVREHTLREVGSKTKADALLDFAVVGVKTNFAANRASWHGTTEYLVQGGALTAFLIGSSSGTVGALSLFVALSDINGVNMYTNAGGIQVLSKLSGRNFVTVPRHELFADEERNRQAVNIALNPLIGKTDPPAVSNSSARDPQ
jgi:hypothetical protein